MQEIDNHSLGDFAATVVHGFRLDTKAKVFCRSVAVQEHPEFTLVLSGEYEKIVPMYKVPA